MPPAAVLDSGRQRRDDRQLEAEAASCSLTGWLIDVKTDRSKFPCFVSLVVLMAEGEDDCRVDSPSIGLPISSS